MSTFDPRSFRSVMASFATGVTVATAALPDGTRAGITVNSFTSVSLEPPLVLFCIGKHALAWPVFHRAPGFSINVLSAQQEHVARAFAVPGQGPERWEHGSFTTATGGQAPVLEGALAHIECVQHGHHEAGDHMILIGRVVAMNRQEGEPLLYWHSGYRHLTSGQ